MEGRFVEIPPELKLKIGTREISEAGSGLSVLLFDEPSPAGMHICSSAAGTRQTDGLKSGHVVQQIHALLLTGGSSFGLDATGGVLNYLREQGKGMQTPYGVVPSCPSAVIFDIGFKGNPAAPSAEDAYLACESARAGKMECGSIGAGYGATVAKLRGLPYGMKGGQGMAIHSEGDLHIMALAVVNAYGEVYDSARGKTLAGVRKSETSLELEGSEELIRKCGYLSGQSFTNTTLAVIVTNGRLDKNACIKAAQMASAGIARAIRPAFSPTDGDVVFVVSTGEKDTSPGQTGSVGAELLEQAIHRAVIHADGLGVIPSHSDVFID